MSAPARTPVVRAGEPGDVTVRGVAIPVLDPEACYNVSCVDSVVTRLDRTADRRGNDTLELWPGYPAQSTTPYPELAHCGYAATSMRDTAGRTGHGVEFPAPVFMLGVEDDVDLVLAATAGVAAARRIPAVIDCNTLEELRQAYACGFRLFAHSVRDVELSEEDWDGLAGARFVSTLAGLRPMIMEREEFLAEYDRPSFRQTQDPANLDFAAKIKQPYGIEFNCQETRTAALTVMRANALAALRRGVLLVGTDCGNTGAYHGYSLLSELDLLAGDDAKLHDELRRVTTVGGWRFFNEFSSATKPPGGERAGQPIEAGRCATFNLLRPTDGTPLSALPEATVVKGVVVDRAAIERDIRALRTTETKGKVLL